MTGSPLVAYWWCAPVLSIGLCRQACTLFVWTWYFVIDESQVRRLALIDCMLLRPSSGWYLLLSVAAWQVLSLTFIHFLNCVLRLLVLLLFRRASMMSTILIWTPKVNVIPRIYRRRGVVVRSSIWAAFTINGDRSVECSIEAPWTATDIFNLALHSWNTDGEQKEILAGVDRVQMSVCSAKAWEHSLLRHIYMHLAQLEVIWSEAIRCESSLKVANCHLSFIHFSCELYRCRVQRWQESSFGLCLGVTVSRFWGHIGWAALPWQSFVLSSFFSQNVSLWGQSCFGRLLVACFWHSARTNWGFPLRIRNSLRKALQNVAPKRFIDRLGP